MKLMHICLASHYTEGMTYQDNQLADQNSFDGHEVILVSDTFKYSGHDLIKVEECDQVLSSGVRLIRLNYDNILGAYISSKIRKVKKLEKLIIKEKPNVILFHGVAGYEMLTVCKYKDNNPGVKLYIDSHEDYHNSGTVWVSLFFQYRIFNRWIVNRIKKSVDKFLYVSEESNSFIREVYGLSDKQTEYYPLGGNIIERDVKYQYSADVKMISGLNIDDLLVVHSGKFNREKRTVELLKAFTSIKNKNIHLFLIGSIPPDMELEINNFIEKDPRIKFLGWMPSKDLLKYLCAADLYFQPGTQSATMQNAICCGTPVALYPYKSHAPYINGNGFFVENEDDYIEIFNTIINNKSQLINMSNASYEIAFRLLDYKKLAARLYQ